MSGAGGKKKSGKRASKPPATPPVAPAPSVGQTTSASQPAPAKAPAPQPAPPKAPVAPPPPAPPQTVSVVLSAYQPNARRVTVAGEFNGWSAAANPMEPRGEGRWQTTLALKPGRYQYKFIVDGEWMPDPDAKQNVYNTFGTLNSVVEVA